MTNAPFFPPILGDLTAAARAAMPPDFNIVRWVEANRVLDRRSSAEAGPKRIARTPALKPIYEWFLNEHVREIIIHKPAQIGVSDLIVDLFLWIAVNDPSPCAFFLSDQTTAQKLMKHRIVPAFKALGLISRRKKASNKQQDVSKFEMQLDNGFYLAISWGSSISQTASMAYKYIAIDELNKPGYNVVGEESDTTDRIRERSETFGGSKIILLSTPTLDDGRITLEFNSADVQYDYCVPCCKCGTFQALSFKGVVWEGGSKASRSQIHRSARYKCIECGELWTDEERQAALALGRALPRQQPESMEKVGYQLHRLHSLFKGGNLARMAYSFIKADKPAKLQNVVNSTFGEPWVPTISPKLEDRVILVDKCKSGMAKGVIPQDAVAIVAAIDTQQQGFWWRVRAACKDGSTYGIDEGFASTFDELDDILYNRSWGNLKVWRALIDTGGGKNAESPVSRTEEVYIWLRKNQGRGVQLFGTKGSSSVMATKIKIGRTIERTPSGKPLPGGIKIIIINTPMVKDALWYHINKTAEQPEQPGGWYIHRDSEPWVAAQICAEEKRIDRKKGGTKWVRTNPDNHMFDLECLCHVCIDPEFYGGLIPIIKSGKYNTVNNKPAVPRVAAQQQLDEQNPITSRRY